jgi:hypothetical protein
VPCPAESIAHVSFALFPNFSRNLMLILCCTFRLHILGQGQMVQTHTFYVCCGFDTTDAIKFNVLTYIHTHTHIHACTHTLHRSNTRPSMGEYETSQIIQVSQCILVRRHNYKYIQSMCWKNNIVNTGSNIVLIYVERQ